MKSKEKLLTLRSVADAGPGAELKTPGKRLSKKKMLMQKFEKDYAAGKWRQTITKENLIKNFYIDYATGKWNQKRKTA